MPSSQRVTGFSAPTGLTGFTSVRIAEHGHDVTGTCLGLVPVLVLLPLVNADHVAADAADNGRGSGGVG